MKVDISLLLLCFHDFIDGISEAVAIETWFDIDKTRPEPTIDCRKKKSSSSSEKGFDITFMKTEKERFT